MLLQALAEAFSAMLLMPFLNTLQSNHSYKDNGNIFLRLINDLFSGFDKDNHLVYMLLSITILMSLVQLIMIINNRLILKFSMFEVQNKVSKILYENIIQSKLKFFYNKRSGDLINNLTTDVNRAHACVKYLLLIITNLFFAIGYILAGILLIPIYTFYIILLLLVFNILFTFVLPYFRSLGIENRKAQENANNVIVESIQGFRSIVISCSQKYYQNIFEKIIHTFYYTIYKSMWVITSLPLLLRLLALLSISIILLLNITELSNGDSIYFTKILFLVYITFNVYRYISIINTSYASFAFNFEGIKELLELNKEANYFKNKANSNLLSMSSFNDSIQCKQLCFEHTPGTSVLQNISFEVKKNQKVAIVGRTGSGKSTLVDVLTGFHDNYRGTIKIDGKNFKNIYKDDWRELLGYVSQEAFIFNDTVKNNLIFGLKEDISKKDLERACNKAQILETILSFEKGFNTILGERGIRLSGGEKQRLAIARLFLKNPTIVVLDEATSSLDSESEDKVKQALNSLSKGRTMIAVAHRLSTISEFDNIIVLENGEIVESGTHKELVKKNGVYKNFYTIQAIGLEVNK
jgi:ATP-binding cassette, subfamily B, bacterial MsbA